MPRVILLRRYLLGAVLLPALLAAGCSGDRTPDLAGSPGDLLARLAAGVRHDDAVAPGAEGCRTLLGSGWLSTERDGRGGTFAWTGAPSARILLPVGEPGPGRLRLVGYGLADGDGPRRLELLANGNSLGTRDLPPSMEITSWDVPAGGLRAGLNELELRIDRTVSPLALGLGTDERELGVLVDWIDFVPAGTRPRGNPYARRGGAQLQQGRLLTAGLAHAAGATLELAWSGRDAAPVVAVAAAAGSAPLLAADLADSAGAACIALPADLPGGCLLSVRGAGGELTAARLVRGVPALDVILIVVDSLRPDFLGCYGADAQASPAMDALAADGILFARAYTHAPLTAPAHASLFTSRLPFETGVLADARGALPGGLPTLAEILLESGWHTGAAVAVSHLGRGHGFGRGFTVFDDRLETRWLLDTAAMAPRIDAVRRQLAAPAFLLAHLADPHEPYDAHGLAAHAARITLDGREVAMVPTSTYTPTSLDLDVPGGRSDLVIEGTAPFLVTTLETRTLRGEVDLDRRELDGQARSRFVLPAASPRGGRVRLVLGLADQVDGDDELRARYAREVAAADRGVGALLDSLRAVGRYAESLIILTADHGESLGEDGCRGHGQNLDEAMTRIPLIIKPPRGDGRPAGEVRRDLAGLVDVLPTVLARAGLPPLPGVRGRDLLAPGAADVAAAVFMETHPPRAPGDLYGLRTATGRVIHDPATGAWDCSDPAAASCPQDRALLQEILAGPGR